MNSSSTLFLESLVKLAERSSEELDSDMASSLDDFSSREDRETLSSQSPPLMSQSESAKSLMFPSKVRAPGQYSW